VADKPLPSNLQAEQAVLGAVLSNNRAYDQLGGLQPEHFADDVHREIFRVCQRMIETGQKACGVTIRGALENTGLFIGVPNGVGYLADLHSAMVMIDGVGAYADVIRDCALRRHLILASQDIIERAYRTDLEDEDGRATASYGIDVIEDALDLGTIVEAATMESAVNLALKQSTDAQMGDKAAMGLETGVPSLDAMWRGIYPGSLEIVAARPRTGKTALACQIARKVAADLLDQGSGCVVFFSLEMPAEHVGLVNLASLTGISADDIRSGNYNTVEAYQLIQAQQKLRELPIIVLDKPNRPLLECIGEMRSLKRRRNLRLAIFDHRNRIGRDKQFERLSTLDWYNAITRRLKDAAKMLKIPIICLIQINRGVENRDDPRPRLSDIEYAGEQDADDVVLLFRPILSLPPFPQRKEKETAEQCANRQSVWYANRASMKDMAEALFVKRRFGEGGTVRLKFDGPRTTFSDPPAEGPSITDLWSGDT
jgi:replicative DNA helicase